MENPFITLQAQLSSLEHKINSLGQNLGTSSAGIENAMTVTDAAEYLGISKGTLYNLHSKGIIKSYKRGKRLYFFKSELNETIKSQTI